MRASTIRFVAKSRGQRSPLAIRPAYRHSGLLRPAIRMPQRRIVYTPPVYTVRTSVAFMATKAAESSLKTLLSKSRQLARQKNWANLRDTIIASKDKIEDPELSALLIRSYAELGNPSAAQAAFDEIQQNPKVTYTSNTFSALAHAYAKDANKIRDLYTRMKSRVNKAYHSISSYRDFFHLLRRADNKGSHKAVLDDLMKLGLVKDTISAEELLPGENLDDDMAMLNEILDLYRSDGNARVSLAASYGVSVIIRRHVAQNELDKAMNMYNFTKTIKLTPDRESFEVLIDALLAKDKLDMALSLYNDMNTGEVAPSKLIYHSLTRYYLKKGDIPHAMEIWRAGRAVPVSFEMEDYLNLLVANVLHMNPPDIGAAFDILEEAFRQISGSFKYKFRWAIATFVVETMVLRGTFVPPELAEQAKKWRKEPPTPAQIEEMMKAATEAVASSDKKMTDKAKEKQIAKIVERKIEDEDKMEEEIAIQFAQDVRLWKEHWMKNPKGYKPLVSTPYTLPQRPSIPGASSENEGKEQEQEKPAEPKEKTTRKRAAQKPAEPVAETVQESEKPKRGRAKKSG